MTPGTLAESATPYTCSRKGRAQYFDVRAGTQTLRDAAWSYPAPRQSAIKRVGSDFVGYVAFELLDLAGPFEVFQQANRLSGGYSCEIISREPGPVRSDRGLQVNAGHGVRDCAPSGIDTLVVAGGTGVDAARDDAAPAGWIAAAAAGARRVTSVCSGVFLLAAAGLVSGRRVTDPTRAVVSAVHSAPGARHTIDDLARPLPATLV